MNLHTESIINLHIQLIHPFVSSVHETDFLYFLPAYYQLPTKSLPNPYQIGPSLVPIERITNGDVAALTGSRE